MGIWRFLSLLLVAFFCIGTLVFSASMSSMDMHNPVAHNLCPMMGMTPTCTGILEHIAAWQDGFASVLVPSVTLIAIAAAFVSFFNVLGYAAAPPLIPRYVSLAPPLYRQLFSAGILNPKAP